MAQSFILACAKEVSFRDMYMGVHVVNKVPATALFWFRNSNLPGSDIFRLLHLVIFLCKRPSKYHTPHATPLQVLAFIERFSAVSTWVRFWSAFNTNGSITLLSFQASPKYVGFTCCVSWRWIYLCSSSDISREYLARCSKEQCLDNFCSERYPLTSQLILENKIPEFGVWRGIGKTSNIIDTSHIDNLYLDFNGIIHNCAAFWTSAEAVLYISHRFASERRGCTFSNVWRADIHIYFFICGPIIWKDKAKEAFFHGGRWCGSACEDESAA